jgi:hypothetical protein
MEKFRLFQTEDKKKVDLLDFFPLFTGHFPLFVSVWIILFHLSRNNSRKAKGIYGLG